MDTNSPKKSSSSKISDIIASVQAQISGEDVIDVPENKIDTQNQENSPNKNTASEGFPVVALPEKRINVKPKLPNEKRKILVVDDDEVTLEIMKIYLQRDYSVLGVSSGKLALDFLSKNTVDLVLLDYMMPEMDGPTVLSRIRHEFPEPPIPIIFLTGVAEKDLVIKGLELYPTGYLLKPVIQSVLLDRVHKVLFE